MAIPCNANASACINNASACIVNASACIVNASACIVNASAYIVNASANIVNAFLCIKNATNLRKTVLLIEAVISNGPINPKRKNELKDLFKDVQIPLVMVTTFLTRKAMVKYMAEIAWETDVWVAEDSAHLIHFNGEYLLQAYQREKKQTS